jgi:hypothetical protein
VISLEKILDIIEEHITVQRENAKEKDLDGLRIIKPTNVPEIIF